MAKKPGRYTVKDEREDEIEKKVVELGTVDVARVDAVGASGGGDQWHFQLDAPPPHTSGCTRVSCMSQTMEEYKRRKFILPAILDSPSSQWPRNWNNQSIRA
jgi:hypothetical protein